MVKDHVVEQLQIKVLDMMKWFHSMCISNNLRYYAICGTMLGAARHSGYIPWDDDIDIAMPRADYNRLEEVMKNLNNNRYILETPYTEDRYYCYPISKLYDTNTTLIENKRNRLKRGVFIDIFPLDGIGNDYKAGIANYYKIKAQYNVFLSRVCAIRKGRDIRKNFVILMAGLVPGFLINEREMRIRIDQMCQKYDFDSSEWCGALLSAWGEKEIVNKRVYGKPTLYKFEDTEIYGVEHYDEYLTHIYGDWRKLPPIEKRITHHDFKYLDLDKPYLQ